VPHLVHYYQQHYDPNFTQKEFTEYNYAHGFKCSHEEANKIFAQFSRSKIWHDSHERFEPTEECKLLIADLAKTCDLYVVTAREPRFESITWDFLNNKFGQGTFKGVLFGNHFGDSTQHKPRSKAEMCQSIDAKLLIDDNHRYIAEVTQAGIHGILFGNYAWTKVPLTKNKHLIHYASCWKSAGLVIDKIISI
jgi:uncharacterized HAD superfamily protein